MTARPLKVGLVQMAMTDDPARNLARAVDGVREAAKGGARLVVLPELFRSRYFCQSENAAFFALAEAVRFLPSDQIVAYREQTDRLLAERTPPEEPD